MSPGLTDTGLPSPSLVGQWLRAATADPAALPDEGYAALLGADGPQLDELCRAADSLRERAVGNGLTYVVNRNLDPSAVAGPDPASRRRLAALVAEARELGATEVCMQGPLPPDSDDDYLDLIAAVKAPAPEIHLHAFRPPELLDGAARCGMPLEEFLLAAREAGLGSVPGTAARILDDEVRARLAGRPRPAGVPLGGGDRGRPPGRADLDLDHGLRAHRDPRPAGRAPADAGRHPGPHRRVHRVHRHAVRPRRRSLRRRSLRRRSPAALPAPAPWLSGRPRQLPAPTPAPGLVGADVPGPSWRQVRAVHAVARLMLHGRIANIQAAWPKFGLDASVDLLRSGANDLGGLLLDGRLAPDAGAEAGPGADARRRPAGRPGARTAAAAAHHRLRQGHRRCLTTAGVTSVDVLIVGAGFAGIGMGIQLARRGRESFVIIEQADDVGGTWRDNRYPGVSCDIPSHLYSFSFRPNPQLVPRLRRRAVRSTTTCAPAFPRRDSTITCG